MNDTIDRGAGAARAARNAPASDPVHRLQSTMAAARVSFTWLGTRRTLTPRQKQEAADTFDAEGRYLSAGKKLLDTAHPAFRAVTGVRNRAIGYWRGVSLPYPEPGIRLIRQDRIEPFNRELTGLRQQLTGAVAELQEHYQALKGGAHQRLGRLFDERDYPPSLAGLFDLEWDFPSVQPPEYLRQLSPALYAQESARVSARFEEAVVLAEQAFTAELSKLVAHLSERLGGNQDGKPKVFRDTAVENLSEFFNRFRQLNVRSSPQLDELAEQAQRVIRGVAPEELRASGDLRQRVAAQLSAVQSKLDGLLVDKPRRKILRTITTVAGAT
ncbi:MAG: hypothetical protein JWN40_1131 [Phycisphaerales bacterium]|nr:hypothetical protein [Phycisphaerales bacterium]